MDERQPGCSTRECDHDEPQTELAGVAGEGSRGAPPARLLDAGLRAAYDAAHAWLRPMPGHEARYLRGELKASLEASVAAVSDRIARVHFYAAGVWSGRAGAKEVVRAIEEGFQYDDEAEARESRFCCAECGIKYDRDRTQRHLCTSCADEARMEVAR